MICCVVLYCKWFVKPYNYTTATRYVHTDYCMVTLGFIYIYAKNDNRKNKQTNARPPTHPIANKNKKTYHVSETSSKSTPSSSPSVSPSSSVPPQSANLPLTGTRLGIAGTPTMSTTNGNKLSASRRAFRRGAGTWSGASGGGGGWSSSPVKSTRPSRIMLFLLVGSVEEG